VVNVYEALFKAWPSDVDVARRAFYRKHKGKEIVTIYNKYLRHYVESPKPSLLAFAPHNIYRTWLWYELGKAVAERLEDEFEAPPQWMALEYDEEPLTNCVVCGNLMEENLAQNSDRYGISGPVCIVCHMTKLDLF